MNDRSVKPYLLALLFIGAITLSALLWWISHLTGGPENGGRYDVPAVNAPAWWGFLMSAFSALMVGGLCLDRLGRWVESRRREPHVGDQRRP